MEPQLEHQTYSAAKPNYRIYQFSSLWKPESQYFIQVHGFFSVAYAPVNRHSNVGITADFITGLNLDTTTALNFTMIPTNT